MIPVPCGKSIELLPIKEGRKEMFYLTTHSTHFIYGYMASDIWLRTILIMRKETRCRHMGYSFRLTARVLLYAPYHSLCYTSHGALAGMRNSSMGASFPLKTVAFKKIIIINKKKRLWHNFQCKPSGFIIGIEQEITETV